MMPVAILSPGYPDTPGGVTDHTARLVANWESSGAEVTVVGQCDTDPEKAVAQLDTTSIQGVLVQYVPFLYGRRGLSQYPERLAKSARTRGIRVTTFVHEPWVPANRPQWWILSPLQKRQLRRVLGASDATVTAVPAWQQMLGGSVELVYVGCVQPAIEPPDVAGPLLEAPVVFSPFAAGLNWEWVSQTARELNSAPGLIVVGADSADMRRHSVVQRFYEPRWDCRGRLPADAVLNTLSCARLVLAPFVDGATGRRTSIAAALSVGAPVLSSRGHLFDSAFDGPVSIARDLSDFVSRAKEIWDAGANPDEREDRLRWYRENLDPKTLDASLLRTVTGRGD